MSSIRWKGVLGTATELALVAVVFGPSALFVAAPALWITRRYGRRGVRQVLVVAMVLLGASALVSTFTESRLDALFADRRALAHTTAGLAAALVVVSLIEFAVLERARGPRLVSEEP